MKRFVTLSACVCVILLVCSTVFAQAPAVTTKGRAGNYCIECHVAGDARLDRAFEWQGGIGREQVSPCPTLKKLHEQIYYTESLLGAMTNSGKGLQAYGVSTSAVDRRILARMETYGRLTQENVSALTPVETEIVSLRLQLNKAFSQMYLGWGDVNTRWAIVAAGIITLLLAGTILWRLAQPTRRGQSPSVSPLKRAWSFSLAVLLFFLFALPVFSTAAPASVVQTAEQAQRQNALDTAAKAARAAETASARAWMLARIGASWAAVDKVKGQAALESSLVAMDEFQLNTPAYWGRTRQLQESAVTWPVSQEAAADAADRIAVAASRAWSLRAIAAEAVSTDRARGQDVLARAQAVAEKNENLYYRDLDLYGIAVEWSKLDVDKGMSIARTIHDPMLQAAAFRDMGLFNAHKSAQPVTVMFEQSLQSARQAPLVEQVWSLQELGVAWAKFDKVKGAEVLTEAQSLVAEITLPQDRAFAMRNLAAAWASVDAAQAAQVAESIDAAYPEVKASALHQAGQFEKAVESAQLIDRLYRRENALAAIARDWAGTSPDRALEVASALGDVYLRADVQRAAAVALASSPDRALEIANHIAVPFAKAQALVELGSRWAETDKAKATTAFQEALALTDQLQDTYPMKELAIAWAMLDTSQALQAVEKIQRDVDRADALREISTILAAKDMAQAETVFERALAAAQSMRRSGDLFASAQALRQLGVAWTAIDSAKAAQAFEAAFEAAKRVSVKY